MYFAMRAVRTVGLIITVDAVLSILALYALQLTDVPEMVYVYAVLGVGAACLLASWFGESQWTSRQKADARRFQTQVNQPVQQVLLILSLEHLNQTDYWLINQYLTMVSNYYLHTGAEEERRIVDAVRRAMDSVEGALIPTRNNAQTALQTLLMVRIGKEWAAGL